jgi:hypothetical protein
MSDFPLQQMDSDRRAEAFGHHDEDPISAQEKGGWPDSGVVVTNTVQVKFLPISSPIGSTDEVTNLRLQVDGRNPQP